MIIPLLSNLQHSEPADHVRLCFCLPLFVLKSGPLSITVSHFKAQGHPVIRNHGETIDAKPLLCHVSMHLVNVALSGEY